MRTYFPSSDETIRQAVLHKLQANFFAIAFWWTSQKFVSVLCSVNQRFSPFTSSTLRPVAILTNTTIRDVLEILPFFWIFFRFFRYFFSCSKTFLVLGCWALSILFFWNFIEFFQSTLNGPADNDNFIKTIKIFEGNNSLRYQKV